jgi:hypothetical protein
MFSGVSAAKAGKKLSSWPFGELFHPFEQFTIK